MRVETKIARRVFALFLGFFVFAMGSTAEAAPRDGRVVEGAGSITQSGTHTDIHQNSDFLATRWGNFNIAAHESVQAHQPGASSRLLIRVDGGGATNIAGTFTANGITILENQNGVQFSRGAIVNVGGLLATSSRISGVSGAHWQLNGTGGAVINHGQITAGAGGAILAAVKVQNTGDITAKGGDVALGAGSSFTVDFAGSMVGFEITQAASGASIANTGKIEAQGGVVSLSAQEAQAVRTNVVSVGGVVKATKMERRGGVVYLSGGTQGIAEVSGDVQADEKVQTTGEYIVVKEGALLKAPEILVGGDFQGRDGVQTAKRTLVEAGALLNAGKDGRVIVWSDDVTWFNGNITAPGGFAEVSGKEVLASVNLAGIDVGKLLLDPADIIIAASGMGIAVPGNVAAADTPSGTLTLDVESINSSTANLSLAASNTITVMVAINKPTGGLSLIAGGEINIHNNINTGTGDLTLRSANIFLRSPPNSTITFEGGVITLGPSGTALGLIEVRDGNDLGQNVNVTVRASGNIVLNSNIALSGNSGPALRLTAGMGAGAAGNIIHPNTTAPTLGPFILFLQQDEAFAADAFIIGTVPGGGDIRLGSAVAQEIHPWMFDFGRSGGPLTIRGVDGITLTSIITTGATTTGGFADLRATTITLGGDLSASTGMNLVADTINLTAAVTLTSRFNNGSNISLTGAINTSGTGGNHALEVNAAGRVTLNSNINTGTGNLILTGEGGITLGGNITLDGNRVDITGDINGSTNNRNLTINAIRFSTLGGDTINLGTGNLTLAGQEVFLRPSALAVSITAGDVTLTGVIDESGTNFGLIVNASGVLTLNSNIATGEIDLTLTGMGGIVLGNNITLAGDEVTLTGAIDESGMGDNNNLIITAGTSGTLTLNSNINLGTGNLTLTGGGGIALGRAITLTGGVVALTGAIDTSASGNDGLTISASGVLTLNSNINTGTTGALTLSGDTIALGGTTTLTGGAVSLTGAIDTSDRDSDNLTINASGRLTLNSNINLGGGTLDINAGELISFAIRNILITAGAFTVQFTSVANEAAGFTINSVNTLLTLNSDSTMPVSTIVPRTDCGGEAECTISSGLLSNTLTAATSITLAFGTEAITFGGLGEITITSPIVTITAATIDLRGRSLTITSMGTTLALNLNADISNAATINIGAVGKALTLTSTGARTLGARIINLRNSAFTIRISKSLHLLSTEELTSNTGIAVSGTGNHLTLGASGELRIIEVSNFTDFERRFTTTGGNITLNAQITNVVDGAAQPFGGISLGTNLNRRDQQLILNAGVNIIMPVDGSTVGLVRLNSAGGEMSTNTSIISSGMINLTGIFRSEGSNLTINAGGVLQVGGSESNGVSGQIDLGSGTLDLTATGGIAPTSAEALTLIAGNITIRSAINRERGELAVSGLTISISATGGMFTLHADITYEGSLSFSGRGILALGDNITIRAESFRMVHNVTATSADDNDLSITTTTGNITLTGGDSINLGTGDLNLNSAGDIFLESDITLTGGAITLTGAIDQDFNPNPSITINASRVLTLNNNIDLGTGDITLTGTGGIVLGGDITLIGGAISLTGAIDESAFSPDAQTGKGGRDDLTITASGVLTLGSSINLGAGGTSTLTITAERISVTMSGTMLTAADPISITFTGAGVTTPAQGFTVGGIQTFGRVMGGFSPSVEYGEFPPLSCDGLDDCVLGGGGEDLLLPETLMTANSITLNAGRENEITFDGMGPILISAPTVMITARRLFITGARTLTITATGGALMLNTIVRSEGGESNNIILTATGGVLTLGDSVTGGIDSLTLSGTDVVGSDGALTTAGIRLTRDITLNGVAISLSGTIAEADASTDSLTIMAGGVLTLNNDIALGMGNLTLSGTNTDITDNDSNVIGQRGIKLGASIFLDAAAITLTGEIDESSDGRSLFIRAGRDLTINSDISLGLFRLSLTAGLDDGTGNILTTATTKPAFTSSDIVLVQDRAFANDADIPFTLVIPDPTLGTGLTLTTSDSTQTIYNWMIRPNGNLDLSVMGATSTITITQDVIDLRNTARTNGGQLSLEADNISFASADLMLFVAGVSLNGVVSRSGSDSNADLTIMSVAADSTVSLFGDVNLGSGTFSIETEGFIRTGNPAPQITADTVDWTFIQDAFTIDSSTFHQNTFNTINNLILNNTTGRILVTIPITLAGNITLNGVNTASQTALAIVGNIISTSGNITLGDSGDNIQIQRTTADTFTPITLMANNITLNGNVSLFPDGRRSSAGGGSDYSNLVLMAATNLMINADFIDVGFGGTNNNRGRLELRAGGSITHTHPSGGSGGLQIIARDEVILMQSGAFSDSLLSTSMDDTLVNIRLLTINTGAAPQPVHDWMIAAGRSLSLTTTDAITIAQTLLELGAGNLTLDGVSISFTNTTSSTITAANITLNVTPTVVAPLILTASGTLAFGADVANISACSIRTAAGLCDITDGALVYYDLTLTGMSGITLAFADTSDDFEIEGKVVAVSGAISTVNTNLSVRAQGNLTVGAIDIGTGALDLRAGRASDATGAVIFTGSPTIVAASVFLVQDVQFVENAPATFLDSDDAALGVRGRFTSDSGVIGTRQDWLTVQTINAVVDLAGDGLTDVPNIIDVTDSITLDAGTGAIAFADPGPVMLTAPTITITAGSITLGARSLTIDTEGGTITLNLPGITTTGSVTLTAQTINFNPPSPSTMLMIDAASLSIAQDAAFGSGSTRRIDLHANVKTLTLSTQIAQTFHSWMADVGRTVSLTSTGVIMIADPTITLGMGNLTLSGSGINFTNEAGLTITAGAVSLTGAVSSDNLQLQITAGGALMLGDINTGTGNINLMGTSIVLGSDITLEGGAITLTGDVTTTGALTITARETLVGGGPRDDEGRIIYSSTPTRSGGDVNIGAITLASGDLTITADANIILGGNLTASGGTITLTAGNSENTIQVLTFTGDFFGDFTTVPRLLTRTGNIGLASGVVPVFDASTVNLTQDGAFTAQPLADASVIGSLNIDVRAAPQPYANWMGAPNRNVSLMTTGAITISQSAINLGTGDLTLEGSGITFTNAAGLTIMADAVSLNGAVSSTDLQLTIMAGGVLTLNRNITTVTGNITLRGATIVLGGNVVLTGGAVSLTGAINEMVNARNLSVNADGDITLNDDITLTLGNLELHATGNIMNGSEMRTIISVDLSLRQAAIFDSNLFSSSSSASGAVSLRVRTAVEQTIHGWMTSLGDGDFSLQGEGVTLTSITVPVFTRTGAIDLRAATITLNSALTGTTVSLRADTIAGDGDNLVAIHATNGDLTATGADGMDRPALAISVTAFSLTQNSAFERDALPFTFVSANITEAIILSTSAAQTYRDWMDFPGRTLSLTTTDTLTIDSASINTGTGDLTLSGTNGIMFTNAAGLTITAGEVTLTGAVSAANLPLTIRTQRDITLGAITLGTGALDLQAGLSPDTTNAINFVSNPAIMANSVRLAQDEQFVDTAPATFTLPSGVDVEGIYFGDADPFDNPTWLDVRQVGFVDFVMDNDGAALTNIPETIEAAVSITLDAGTNAISFAGSGAIMLSAPTISITAGTIDIGTRSLTIIAADGTLTLSVGTIIASSLTLSADTIAGLSSSLTLTVPTVSFTLTRAGSSFTTRPFSVGSSTIGTSLSISVEGDQSYFSWMVAEGRTLSLRSGGVITIGEAAINLGTGDLTLTGMSIMLTSVSSLEINAGVVNFTGGVFSNEDRNLSINAGGNIVLNGNIDIAGGELDLITTGGNISPGVAAGGATPTRELTASAVSLTHVGAFGATDWTIVSNNLTLMVGGGQMVHDWMVADGRTLSLTSTGGAITIGGDIDIGVGDLTLSGMGIALGDDVTLIGGVIILTGAIDESADDDSLTITATGSITINSDINLGTGGGLSLTAGSGDGTGDILTPTMPVFMVGTLSLTQDGAFNARPFSDTSTIATELSISVEADQRYFGWMRADGRNLSLRSGGAITVGAAGINLGTGDLTFDSTNGITFTNGRGLTITAGEVSLVGVVSSDNLLLAITAQGDLTLNNNINTGTGNITLDGGMDGSIVLVGAITLTGGAISLTGAIDESASGNDGNDALTVRAQSLTLNSDINLGTGRLDLQTSGRITSGGTARVITAGSLRLAQLDALDADLLDPTSRVAGSVALLIGSEVVQTVHPWMASLSTDAVVADSSLVLRGRGVRLDVIILPEATTFTGSVNFVARQIEFRGALTAREITFTTNVIRPDRSADDADRTTLALNAVAGDITTFAILDDGTRGAGNALLSRDFVITTLILRQNSAFGDLASLPFSFNPRGQQVAALTAITLTINASDAAQTLQAWMLPEAGSNRDLTITAVGEITVNAGAINLGTGNLMLNGTGGIAFTNTGGLTITSGEAALVGAVSAADLPLTIRVQGDVTINSAINLGTGRLDLRAGLASGTDEGQTGAINFMNNPAITAGSVRLAQDEQFVSTRPFTLPAGVNIEGAYFGAPPATDRGWLTVTQVADLNVDMGDGTALEVQAVLEAFGFIRLDAGENELSFAGTGAIMLTAPTITIIAGTINAGERTMTITAEGGTLTLTGVGTITASSLTLSADTFAGLSSALTLTVPTVSLVLTGASSFTTRPFSTANSTIETLSVSAQADQAYLGWMGGATGRNLILTSTGGAIIINNAINTGAGDLTLSGMSITLSSAITLTGGAISLTGAIDESASGNDALTVQAQSLTLNSDINLGTGRLNLQTSGRITSGGTAPVITAGSLRLAQLDALDADLLDPTSRVAGSVALLIGSAVDQIVHPWMASLSTGAVVADSSLVLRGRGVRLDVVIVPEATTFTGSVNFVARQIEFRGALTARDITFTTNVIRPDRSAEDADKTTLELNAVAGDITTFAILADGTRGAGNALLSRDFAITTLILRRNSAFGDLDSLPFRFNPNEAAQPVTALTTLTLTINASDAAQILQTWMLPETDADRDLTITAGGELMVNDDINLGTGNLTLSGTSITLGGATALTGGAISLTGNVTSAGALTITAATGITLGNNINTGTGDLTLSGTSITLGSAITLTGGAISLTGAIDETASGNDGNDALTVRAQSLTLNSNIDLGTGRLDLQTSGRITSGGTARVITAGSLRLAQLDALDADLLDPTSRVAGSVALLIGSEVVQTVHPWMASLSVDAAVVADSSLVLRGRGVRLDVIILPEATTFTGSVNFVARQIEFRGFLTAREITFTTNVIRPDRSADDADRTTLELNAVAGDITTFAILDDGTRGAGNAVLSRDFVITTLILRQNSAFGDLASLPFSFNPRGQQVAALTAITLIINASDATQTVQDWMLPEAGSDRDLSITAVGEITVNAAGINLGTGDLTLTGSGVGFTNTAGLRIDAGAVTLSGAVSDNLPLTIQAQQGIVFNNSIDIGTAALDLVAGLSEVNSAAINLDSARVPDPADPNVEIPITVRAGSFRWVQDVQFGTTPLPAANFMLPSGVRIEGLYFGPDATATPRDWLDVRKVENFIFDMGDGTAALTNVPETLDALVSITLNAGTNAISFAGTGAIMLTAPTITITAGMIDIGARTLTIIAEGGTLTLGVSAITASSLTLSANTIEGLSDSLTLTVPTVSLTLTGASSFTTRPFSDTSTIATELSVSAEVDQRYFGWMRADNRNLNLTSGGMITVGAAGINLVTGSLTFNSGGGITFTNGRGLTITAREVSLVGAIDGSASNLPLTVTASGNLNLHNNINTGTGDLSLVSANIFLRSPPNSTIRLEGGVVTLGPSGTALGLIEVRDGNDLGLSVNVTVRARGNIVLNSNIALSGSSGPALRLIAGRGDGAAGNITRTTDTAPTLGPFFLFLQQDDAFTVDAFMIGNVTSGGNIRLGSAVEQEIHPWMVALGNSGGPLSIRGADDITLTSITTATGATIIGGSIDLRATTINLGGDLSASTGMMNLVADTINLTAAVVLTTSSGDISLTGAVNAANFDFTATANRTLTLNSNINTGTGALTLTGTGGIALGSAITLTGGVVSLTGAIDETASGNDGNDALTVRAQSLTLNSDINLGTGRLDLQTSGRITNGGTAPVITAGSLRLAQLDALDADLLDPTSRVAGSVALLIGSAVDQIVHPWMVSLSMGAVVADSSLVLRGRGVRLDVVIVPDDATFIGSVNFVARQIEFRGALTARDITFTTNVIRPDRSADDADRTTLELNAVVGDITTFAILDDGTRGAGNALLSRDFAITTLILRQNMAFGDLASLPFSFNSRGQQVAALTTLTLTINASDAAQIVQTWMLPEADTDRDLTITAEGALTVNDNINLGTGTLSLSGASINFGADATALSAGDFSFSPDFTCDTSTTPTCTDTTP